METTNTVTHDTTKAIAIIEKYIKIYHSINDNVKRQMIKSRLTIEDISTDIANDLLNKYFTMNDNVDDTNKVSDKQDSVKDESFDVNVIKEKWEITAHSATKEGNVIHENVDKAYKEYFKEQDVTTKIPVEYPHIKSMTVSKESIDSSYKPNDRVFIPATLDAQGFREPKTVVKKQVLNGRILLRCIHNINEVVLLGLTANSHNEENSIYQRTPDKIVVAAYGAASSQVLIGDEVEMGDTYSMIPVPMKSDVQWYKNVMRKILDARPIAKRQGNSNIIVPTNPILDGIEKRNELEASTRMYVVHSYLLCDEFALTFRNIEEPNASL